MLKTKYWIYILILSLLGISCKKGTLPAPNSSSHQSAKSITVDVPVVAYKYTNMRTDNKLSYSDVNGYNVYVNTKAVLADYTAETGSIQTAFYSQVMLPQDNFSFGDTSIIAIDSAYLAFDYSSSKIGETFYGDTSAKFNFEVNEITDDLKTEKTPYLSNTIVSYDNTNRADSQQLSILAGTKIKVPNIQNGKKLEDKEIDADIRIKLSNDYVLNKFLLAPKTNFINQQTFLKYFKGFRIKAQKISGIGGLIGFSTYASNGTPLKLIIYYHEKTTSGNYYKEVSLPLANASASSQGIFYSYINNQINDSIIKDTENIYLIPLAGLKAKLDFTKLYNSIGTNKVIINKANIVAGTSTISDNLPGLLTINRGQNTAGNTIQMPDGNNHDYRPINNIDGALHKEDKSYNFNLQKSVYDMLTNAISPNSVFLDLVNPQSSVSIVKLKRSLHLNIIYTVFE